MLMAEPENKPLDDEDDRIAAASERQRNCHHKHLQFGSGGFHIFCMDCGSTWVAKHRQGADTEMARQRPGNLVSTSDQRVPPPELSPGEEPNPFAGLPERSRPRGGS
jgi:hypothetical protein